MEPVCCGESSFEHLLLYFETLAFLCKFDNLSHISFEDAIASKTLKFF